MIIPHAKTDFLNLIIFIYKSRLMSKYKSLLLKISQCQTKEKITLYAFGHAFIKVIATTMIIKTM